MAELYLAWLEASLRTVNFKNAQATNGCEANSQKRRFSRFDLLSFGSSNRLKFDGECDSEFQ